MIDRNSNCVQGRNTNKSSGMCNGLRHDLVADDSDGTTEFSVVVIAFRSLNNHFKY